MWYEKRLISSSESLGAGASFCCCAVDDADAGSVLDPSTVKERGNFVVGLYGRKALKNKDLRSVIVVGSVDNKVYSLQRWKNCVRSWERKKVLRSNSVFAFRRLPNCSNLSAARHSSSVPAFVIQISSCRLDVSRGMKYPIFKNDCHHPEKPISNQPYVLEQVITFWQ